MSPFRFLASLLLFLLPAIGSAQKPAARSPLAGLDSWIDSALTKSNGVGLAIAVVKDDSIVYAKGFGVRKLGDPAPVSPTTLFAVGSTTKAFTAAALGMLVDDGKIAWDDRATDRLPGFELFDPAVTREITIRDLLTHRSGLSRGDRIWNGANLSRAEVIRRVRFQKPTFSLRTVWGYQNMMYLAAGEVIPAVTGISWDDFIDQRIFTPLGMTASTTSTLPLKDRTDVAQPHDERDGKLVTIPTRNIDNVGPAGSIYSNVLEMSQWIRFHLGGGAVGGRRLLTPLTHRELFTPQMWIKSAEGLEAFYGKINFLGYGLGWFLFDRAGRKIVEHSGGIDGFVTDLIMVPEEHLGVIVATNASNSLLAFPVANHVIDRYLGTTAIDRLTPFLAALARGKERARAIEDSLVRSRPAGGRQSLALDGYTGTYDNPMFGPARVSHEGGQLVIRVRTLSDTLALEHWQYDTFRGAWSDLNFEKTFVTFRRAPNGTTAGFTIDGLEHEFVRRGAAVAALACDPSDADRSRLAGRLSPYDSVTIRIGGREARLCYSRPSARGRTIFGGQVVPFDSVWRTGANDPTTINLPFPVKIAGISVPAGKYSITTVPGRTSWQIVVNGATGELGRATVPTETLATPVEKFTIRSEPRGPDQITLVLEWEKTRVSIPIEPAP